jgi:glycosyltransferase involved in cell wall biosynthesis
MVEPLGSPDADAPNVSYIVSAFDRPDHLGCVLYSIKAQTDQSFEVIVTDNGGDARNENVVARLDDSRFRYIDTSKASGNQTSPAWDCYWSGEFGGRLAKGRYLCFPSDDGYYVPCFQKKLVTTADQMDWQLVFCDMLLDRPAGPYVDPPVQIQNVLDVKPMVGCIDKTGFLIRRESWIGWPTKPEDRFRGSAADGEMIDIVRRNGIRFGKLNEVLCVHN